jgi:hypothetical protein
MVWDSEAEWWSRVERYEAREILERADSWKPSESARGAARARIASRPCDASACGVP